MHTKPGDDTTNGVVTGLFFGSTFVLVLEETNRSHSREDGNPLSKPQNLP
jgi:hypothetical protein